MPVVAICGELGGHGIGRISLPVKWLGAERAFLSAMSPPPVGETLSVVFRPHDGGAIAAVHARVISACLDPADADRCGFEIAFTTTDAMQQQMLLELLGDGQRAATPAPRPERRRHPRVELSLEAIIERPAGNERLELVNISMSGAFLVPRAGSPQAVPAPGDEIALMILESNTPECITLDAEVVRTSTAGTGRGFGVRFVDMDEVTTRRLEGLILYHLIGDGLPLLYGEEAVL